MAENRRKGESKQQERCFLPNFCGIRTLFVVVVSAELLALVLTLSVVDHFSEWPNELGLRSLYVQWVALTGTAVLCLLRRRLSRLSHTAAGIVAWLLIQGIATIVGAVSLFALGGDYFSQEPWLFLLSSVAISGIVTALVLRYLYEQHLAKQRAMAESQARLQALQSRIRPHFLFNSMNTIAHLTQTDPALAEEVVQDLADLFRTSLSDNRIISTLEAELDLARGYLRIEAQRLGERMQVIWDLEVLPEQAPLPTLILQPLLENAVYHGIEPADEGGKITISGRYRRQQVNLSIRNTMPSAGSNRHVSGNRMAMDNIRQRLDAFFDNKASLVIGEVEGDYQVRLAFPYPYNGNNG